MFDQTRAVQGTPWHDASPWQRPTTGKRRRPIPSPVTLAPARKDNGDSGGGGFAEPAASQQLAKTWLRRTEIGPALSKTGGVADEIAIC
jgi:hypothetical protein